ncbi:MAG: SpoIID/LytB domain-containing protein [Candidatus Cloacimonetes bacterium]|jgi:SpoIID/LytB domain protein|nr:SpoIID/LytB domain-containing protein [Candidatus Cloacimonadota bacterium]
MRKFPVFLLFGISLLFGAEIRNGMLYLEINLASAQHLQLDAGHLVLSDKDQLFTQDFSGKILIDVVSPEQDNQYGIIEHVGTAADIYDNDAVINSYFVWEDDQLLLKHEYWFFLPDSFKDLEAAQSYAASMNYPLSRVQSIPIVNSTLRIVGQDGKESYFESPLNIQSSKEMWLNGLPYEGEFVLKIRSGKLVLNQILPIEEYIAGVIPNEIGSNSPLEALKAQAVAARTHAVSLLLNNRHSADGYDLCNTTHCQVYKGKHLRNEIIEEAVVQSAGEIIVSDQHIADATYHSSCGGKTDSSQDIWKGAYIPHLGGSTCIPAAEELDLSQERDLTAWISSKVDSSGMSSWEVSSMVWQRSISKAKVAANTGLDSIKSIEILNRGHSGRILKLRITGDRSIVLDGEYKIRQAFGMLPSSMFVFKGATGSKAYYPGNSITIMGRGSGHGVGMCQVGALRKARRGEDYTSILQCYYPGTEIKNIRMEDD